MIPVPVPLYGKAMHDFVLMELELGARAAMAQDAEYCGYGPLFDLLVLRDPRVMREEA